MGKHVSEVQWVKSFKKLAFQGEWDRPNRPKTKSRQKIYTRVGTYRHQLNVRPPPLWPILGGGGKFPYYLPTFEPNLCLGICKSYCTCGTALYCTVYL